MSVFFFGNRIGACRPKRSRLAAAEEKRIFAAMLSTKRILVAALGVVVVALMLPSYANAAYGWPIKPFNRQHPVRGQLNDPRMNGSTFDSSTSLTFHSGVDIATRDGTAVYAVAAGRVHYLDQSAIAVRLPNVAVVFEYWHIVPVVNNKALVKRHALLGFVEEGRGHVHFAQKLNRVYVNPLRRGGLTPYTDYTPPIINSISYYDGAYHDLDKAALSGKIRITVNTYDTQELASNWPWAVVTPTWVEWQLIDESGRTIEHLHRDLGRKLYPHNVLDIFAPGTRKNSKRSSLSFVVGNYIYWVGPERDTTYMWNGTYQLLVTVADIRGNETTQRASFTVANTVAGTAISPARSRAPR
jgi:hypothetical protein